MQEQQAEAERGGQHDADRDIALRFLAQEPDPNAGEQCEGGQPDERRNADQRGARGAREARVAERMAGEGLAAQDEKVADGAGDQRNDGAGRVGIAHEVISERVHARASSGVGCSEQQVWWSNSASSAITW